jgi:hypothetical protein
MQRPFILLRRSDSGDDGSLVAYLECVTNASRFVVWDGAYNDMRGPFSKYV